MTVSPLLNYKHICEGGMLVKEKGYEPLRGNKEEKKRDRIKMILFMYFPLFFDVELMCLSQSVFISDNLHHTFQRMEHSFYTSMMIRVDAEW